MTVTITNNQAPESIRTDLSPLEVAISKFEKKASNFYKSKDNIPLNETEEQRLARENDLSTTLRHLKHERRHISILAKIQTRLQAYQAKGRTMDVDDMLIEKHHPTSKLAKNLRAACRPAPSYKRHSPHHIVQGKGKTPQNADARLLMHECGIRINDPDNGVWMPRTKADKGYWTCPNQPAHSEIHTYNYERWVSIETLGMETEGTFRAKLTKIRILLRDGKQPRKVTESYNKNNPWNGYA